MLRRPVETAQYLSIKYTERMADAGIKAPVGSAAVSYDNALAERIKGLFKAEVIHHRDPWRGFDAVEYAAFECVNWFNNRHPHEPTGNMPLLEAETIFYAYLETEAIATERMSISLRQTRRYSAALLLWSFR